MHDDVLRALRQPQDVCTIDGCLLRQKGFAISAARCFGPDPRDSELFDEWCAANDPDPVLVPDIFDLVPDDLPAAEPLPESPDPAPDPGAPEVADKNDEPPASFASFLSAAEKAKMDRMLVGWPGCQTDWQRRDELLRLLTRWHGGDSERIWYIIVGSGVQRMLPERRRIRRSDVERAVAWYRRTVAGGGVGRSFRARSAGRRARALLRKSTQRSWTRAQLVALLTGAGICGRRQANRLSHDLVRRGWLVERDGTLHL